MKKQKAIELLGGSISAAADAIGISYQGVSKWPDELPPRIADRVTAAIARAKEAREKTGRKALQANAEAAK